MYGALLWNVVPSEISESSTSRVWGSGGITMSKLNVDQKTVKELFENKKSDFLIPDYQRPYAWGESEC